MKEQQLPKNINPSLMADRRQHVGGVLMLRDMPRLAHFLNSNEGEAHISLDFDRDDRHLAYIKGCIKADLLLLCQRCLQPMVFAVNKLVALRPVLNDNQVKLLEPEYDPVMVEGGLIALVDMIEDELILSLPTVALHEKEACTVVIEHVDTESVQEKRVNPFSVLKRD